MNQTFYIDVDEEISSVIDRLRKSVATENFFVVPKRALFVQSIINLKLLKREADNLGKRIILVTQDEYGINMAQKAGLEVKTSPDEFEQAAENGENPKAPAGIQAPPADLYAQPGLVEKNPTSVRLRGIGTNDFYGADQEEEDSDVFVPRNLETVRVPVVRGPRDPVRPIAVQGAPRRNTVPFLAENKTVPGSTAVPLVRPTSSDISLPQKHVPVSQPRASYNVGPMEYSRRMNSEKERSIEKIFRASEPKPDVPASNDIPVAVGGRGRKIIIGFIVLCAVSFIGVAAYVFVPSAKVEIVLDTQKKIVSTQLAAAASSSAGVNDSGIVVPLRIIQKNDTVTLTYNSSGTPASSTSKKAQGSVVIYNAFSNAPQTLIATTRIQTSDGKIFRLVKTVTVPGMSGSGSDAKPGAIEAQIIADQPGDAFNIDPTTFTIPGFQGGPKFDTFSAKSTSPMTGGVSDTASPHAVSDQDIADAKTKAEQALKDKLAGDISSEAQKGDVVLSQAENVVVSQSAAQAKSGDVADSFSYAASGTMTALVFASSDVSATMVTLANKGVDATKFNPAKIATPDYSNITADFNAQTLSANVDAQSTLVPRVDTNAFKQSILGKDESQIKQIVGQTSGIKNVNIDFFPPFISQVPKFPQRVTVTVNTGE